MEHKEDSFDEEWVKWVKNVMKRSKESDKDEWLKQEEEFVQYIENLHLSPSPENSISLSHGMSVSLSKNSVRHLSP